MELGFDSNSRTGLSELRHTMVNLGHIVNFVCAKDLLEPMRPLVTLLQGELIEVYFGCSKIDEVNHSYEDFSKFTQIIRCTGVS